MSIYHVIIAAERRTAMAEALGQLVPVRIQATDFAGQLHAKGESLGDGYAADPQIIYAAEWDGQSPYITVLKGDNSTLMLRYAGWPTITQEEFNAQSPAP